MEYPYKTEHSMDLQRFFHIKFWLLEVEVEQMTHAVASVVSLIALDDSSNVKSMIIAAAVLTLCCGSQCLPSLDTASQMLCSKYIRKFERRWPVHTNYISIVLFYEKNSAQSW